LKREIERAYFIFEEIKGGLALLAFNRGTLSPLPPLHFVLGRALPP